MPEAAHFGGQTGVRCWAFRVLWILYRLNAVLWENGTLGIQWTVLKLRTAWIVLKLRTVWTPLTLFTVPIDHYFPAQARCKAHAVRKQDNFNLCKRVTGHFPCVLSELFYMIP